MTTTLKHGAGASANTQTMKSTGRRLPPLNELEGNLQKDIEILASVLGFFVSVIKSGESWTDECEKEKTAAREALFRLSEKAGNGANG